MKKISSALKNSYLGKLLDRDPLFGRILCLLLVVYFFIHLFRLEVYPLYFFGMFSKQETPKEYYTTYQIYQKDDTYPQTQLNYRKYTVLMNTLSQYDGILSNQMVHPEAEVIDKFVQRLHLTNTPIKASLKGSFVYDKQQLANALQMYLCRLLDIEPSELKVEKQWYTWKDTQPVFHKKELLYGMAE